MSEYELAKNHLLTCDSASNWFKRVILELDERDVMDVLKEISALEWLFKKKMKETMGE